MKIQCQVSKERVDLKEIEKNIEYDQNMLY